MNQYDNNTQAPDARDYIGSYLNKEDVSGPSTVTIRNVRGEAVEGKRKLLVEFAEFVKPLILNTTNIKLLTQLFGTTDTQYWRGEVTLYVDPHIEFAGRVVGGIRLRPATNGAENGASRMTANAPRQNSGEVPF